MTFDALTIAGILSAALSGGFILATAAAQTPEAVHRRSSSATLATRIRNHIRRPAALTGLRRAAPERFKPLRAAASTV
jgi:hypothetical protein